MGKQKTKFEQQVDDLEQSVEMAKTNKASLLNSAKRSRNFMLVLKNSKKNLKPNVLPAQSQKKPDLTSVVNSKNSPSVLKKATFKLRLKLKSTRDVKPNFSSFNAILKSTPSLTKLTCLLSVRSTLTLLLNFPNLSKIFNVSNLSSKRKNLK